MKNVALNRRRFRRTAPLGAALLAIICWTGGTAVQAVPIEPDDLVAVQESAPAAGDNQRIAVEHPTIGPLSTFGDSIDPTRPSAVDIGRQGDHQLIADYHELLFQIGLAMGNRSPQSLADLPTALEAAVGLAISPTGAIVFTGPAYEEFRINDPDVVDEDPATETYFPIVSDTDASAGGADVAAGALVTTASVTQLSAEWTSSASSLDPVAASRPGRSGESPGASNLVYSPQGDATGSSARSTAEPSALALLLATMTAIVITVQAVRQSLKESD